MKQVVCEKKDYMENDKTKHNSQDEILELLENNTLNNQLIIDSNLQIEDTFKIRNPRTGDISALALFRTDSIFCFKKENKTYFILNNFFFNYTSDNYYLTIDKGKVCILFDSTNMHYSCLIPGFNSALKRYKITLNKLSYSIGDTLKCRALFINKGKYNGETKDSTVYFLDSIDAKYIVHQYNRNNPYFSKFPK
ncbi:MAG: hypothetical protein U0U67_03305 [Chitinophagales bacterium]